MTTQTLHLIDEYLMQGGYTPGIDAETLEREAHLVAAAPDLLAALETMVSNYPYWASKMEMKEIDKVAIATARAAITKAKGN